MARSQANEPPRHLTPLGAVGVLDEITDGRVVEFIADPRSWKARYGTKHWPLAIAARNAYLYSSRRRSVRVCSQATPPARQRGRCAGRRPGVRRTARASRAGPSGDDGPEPEPARPAASGSRR